MVYLRTLLAIPCLAFLLAPALAQSDAMCFLRVVKFRDSGFADQQNLVVNSRDEWQTIWDKISANTSPQPPLPEIDFARRTLVCVFQGNQPTSGYEISIQGIFETETSLEVAVKAFAPGKGCVEPTKPTNPLDIVEIEKQKSRWYFR